MESSEPISVPESDPTSQLGFQSVSSSDGNRDSPPSLSDPDPATVDIEVLSEQQLLQSLDLMDGDEDCGSQNLILKENPGTQNPHLVEEEVIDVAVAHGVDVEDSTHEAEELGSKEAVHGEALGGAKDSDLEEASRERPESGETQEEDAVKDSNVEESGETQEEDVVKDSNEEESGESHEENKNGSGSENEVDKVGGGDGSDVDGDGEVLSKGEKVKKGHPYPLRPDAEDCPYYMKTGTCKFGSNCKFNHPVRRKNSQVLKEKVTEKGEELAESLGQTECKYYSRNGGCKFGKACRYQHPKSKISVAPPVLELNFLGLPIRPGEKECPYYMRTGSCKYGANCRFNHPDPSSAGGSDPSGYGSVGSVSLRGIQPSTTRSWTSPKTLNETPALVPTMFPPTQGILSQTPEWNRYQPPVYLPPERSMHQSPAYPATETNVYTHQQQQQMLLDEFPERPGQPECSYFLKTGDCKFKSNCKYHHPKTRVTRSPQCPLSDKGLPLRPDQNICMHYSRYGICKFGPACRYDHPVHHTSTMAGFGQPLAYENPMGARMGGSEAAIHQHV